MERLSSHERLRMGSSTEFRWKPSLRAGLPIQRKVVAPAPSQRSFQARDPKLWVSPR